jgi:hypothetical protein
MGIDTGKGLPVDSDGYPTTIEGLGARHRQWLFATRDFAGGPQIEAYRNGTRHRLVRRTPAELSAAIDQAEASWSWPTWAV